MTHKRTAAAKVNLALHVLGRQPDGYHTISSLVLFTTIGDALTIAPAGKPLLSVRGPFANHVPHDETNLICQALDFMGCAGTVSISLVKRLPVAAGLGGGSSNAATAMQLAAHHLGLDLLSASSRFTPEETAALGADIPVCLYRKPALVSGIGDTVTPVPPLPAMALVLVNPMIPLATRAVYQAVTNPVGQPVTMPPPTATLADFIAWLHEQSNDLEAAAAALAPAIPAVLATLRRSPDCLLARMSGSGSTCFGLYADRSAAVRAAAAIRTRNPDWWVQTTEPEAG